jgi:DNA-binding transcriptional MerR regulator
MILFSGTGFHKTGKEVDCMECTVKKLAQLSGVSSRALRFYDEIGLLPPARISSSGYRLYGEREVNLLQQILLYRELGLSLEEIKQIVTQPDFDVLSALEDHRGQLLERRTRLDTLIENVEKTIRNAKGEASMTDSEKFEGFKQKLIEENEQKYGTEIRAKYGEEAVEQSNRKLKGMTEEDFDRAGALEKQMIELLLEALKTGDPASETAQRAADLHRQWISFYWAEYSKEAHEGVARMYAADPRFTAYYDKCQPGLAKFLRDAVLIYTGETKAQ